MPVAEQFNAFGRGNGFPYCLPEVDVSTYDYWVTLGGTQKGSSPTQAEIDLSLANAMKLFWNYNGHTSLFQDGPFQRGATINIDQGQFQSLRSNREDVSLPFKPKDRVCLVDYYLVDAEDGPAPPNTISGFFTRYYPRVVRMYNDDLFLGYGVSNLIYGFTVYIDTWSFSFRSYANNPMSESVEYSTALNGIPLVASGQETFSDPDREIIINGLSATLYDGGSPRSIMTLSNLDFYTY